MTPNDLSVLIHCHVSPEPHPAASTGPGFSPAVQEAISKFLKDGIIESTKIVGDIVNGDHSSVVYEIALHPQIYTTTEKGKAWLKAILSTPYPELVWLDEKGERIK